MGYKSVFTPSDLANLSQVLHFPSRLDANVVGAVSATVLRSMVIDEPSVLRNFRVKMGTCGTAAGPSTITAKVVRTGQLLSTATALLVSPVSIAHTDADGTEVVVQSVGDSGVVFDEDEVLLEPGDTVYIEVLAAATNAADLHASLTVDRRVDDLEAGPLMIGGKTP